MELTLGSAAHRILSDLCEGKVIAVFSHAVYLEFDDAVLALVVPEVAAGPLHVQVSRLPSARVGMRAWSGGSRLRVGATTVQLPHEIWSPPDVGDVRGALPVLSSLVSHRPVLDVTSGDGVDVTASLDPYLAQGDVSGACRTLFGRGGGLTPAGDDVAAGVLLIAALDDPSRSQDLRAIAEAAATHAISRAFLRAAAGGESIVPVHSFLKACIDNDIDNATRHLQRLREVGHTSGLDLVAGMVAGLMGLSVREEGLSRETSNIHVHSKP